MLARPTSRPPAAVLVVPLILLLLLAACASAPAPTGSPGAFGTPGPSAALLAQTALKLRMIDRFGQPWYCDGDSFPVGRDEQQAADERFAQLQSDPAFPGILTRLGITAPKQFTAAERLAIYRQWKVLQAIALDPIGNGRYRFDYLAAPGAGKSEGTRTAGTISETGAIEVAQQAPAAEPTCPICLSAGTRIDTPRGPVRVDEITIGSPIWTTDAAGRRVAGSVLAVGSVAAPPEHRLVHLVLDDGRVLDASPGHPLSDGRNLGSLRPGDHLDGAVVVSAALVASGPRTWDVLPSGATGTYWANGVLVGSTLRP